MVRVASGKEASSMSVRIPLTQGKIALVSDEDADLAEHRWYYYCPKGRGRSGYAGHWGKFGESGRRAKTFFLHRIIAERIRETPLSTNDAVEHIDGDLLNNQRENLIIVTRSQHMQRVRKLQLASRTSH